MMSVLPVPQGSVVNFAVNRTQLPKGGHAGCAGMFPLQARREVGLAPPLQSRQAPGWALVKLLEPLRGSHSPSSSSLGCRRAGVLFLVKGAAVTHPHPTDREELFCRIMDHELGGHARWEATVDPCLCPPLWAAEQGPRWMMGSVTACTSGCCADGTAV